MTEEELKALRKRARAAQRLMSPEGWRIDEEGNVVPKEEQPEQEPFEEARTILKVSVPTEDEPRVIYCLMCHSEYPLTDLDILTLDRCPSCKTTAESYWTEMEENDDGG
jgi:hypothetical protein